MKIVVEFSHGELIYVIASAALGYKKLDTMTIDQALQQLKETEPNVFADFDRAAVAVMKHMSDKIKIQHRVQ